jgi:hypothetical protein
MGDNVRVWIGAAFALALATGSGAHEFSPTAVVSASFNGTTMWVDGSWRSVGLPTYGLGFHNITAASVDAGAIQSFSVRPAGYGINAGISGPTSAFGSNVRVALQGGYVSATADQSGSATSDNNIGQLLNGQLLAQCGACILTSQLATRHDAWWLAATATSDVRVGVMTLSPLAEIFGGIAQTRQDLSQSRDSLGAITTYEASTRVRWADVGARAGVTATVPLAAAVEAGLGGKVGFAYRQVSLTGTDTGVFVPVGIPVSSSIDVSDTTFAFVANLHGQVIVRPRPGVGLRAFAGLDYDNRVPGIVAPTFTPTNVATTFIGSAATIGYSGHTSYYAGGGITIALGP